MSRYYEIFTEFHGKKNLVRVGSGAMVARLMGADGTLTGHEIASLLNLETAPLHEKIADLQAELAKLQDTNMTLLAALEASSEKLADARGFIRSIFPLEHPGDVRYANQYMQGMIEKWASDSVADGNGHEESPNEA